MAKGMAGTVQRIQKKSAGVCLARTMHNKGPITKARKAWVMAAKERVGKNTASVP